MCENKLKQELLEKLDAYIEKLPDQKSALIQALHYAQEIFGYLPRELQMHVAQKLSIPSAKVNGVVTFYSYFTETPRGKHVINVCMGTACFVRGAADILKKLEEKLGIKAGQTTEDGMFTLDALRCVGACGLAPIAIVDDKVNGRLTLEDVDGLIEQAKKGELTNV